jgi:hypothetical protein
MGQPVSVNYGLLGDLQQKVSQTGTGIDEVFAGWTARVKALEAVWPDHNGQLLAQADMALTTFKTETTQFLQELAAAVARAGGIYQDTDAYVYGLVSRLPGN